MVHFNIHYPIPFKNHLMDTIIGIIESYQFSYIHILLIGGFLFVVGYLVGKRRLKELCRNIYELEKTVYQLNEDLLYGKPETPVIEIKHAKHKMMSK